MNSNFPDNLKPTDFDTKHREDFIDLYYVYRDDEHRPMVTVCLLVEFTNNENFIVHKGYTICSRKDNPFGDYGKVFAFARAKGAMELKEKAKISKKKRLLPIIREEALEVLKACKCEFLFGQRKGLWNTKEHTFFEEKLLEKVLGLGD